MAAVTQSQVDHLITELEPHVDTEAHKLELGLKVYECFLKDRPEYICKFSRLQGLDASNVAQSEGIKYYARTFVAAFVPMIQAAANKCELDKLCLEEAILHRTRPVDEKIFQDSLPIFIKIFNNLIKNQQNKETMSKILTYTFTMIGSQI
uniref:Globin-3 n=1 Tax=Schistosoma japonicum TaxID=6182 RepID=C1LL90_SCHJA|nr:Globin-3 [Schistosoma japonicum]